MKTGVSYILLFDKNYKLRQGNLFVPIFSNELEFPFEKLLEISEKIVSSPEMIELKRQINNENDPNILTTLQNKFIYEIKKLPFPLYEIEFQSFSCPVLYKEMEVDHENKNFNLGDTNLKATKFSSVLKYHDPGYSVTKIDYVQEYWSFLQRDESNPQDLRPTKEEIDELMRIISRHIMAEMSSNERNLVWKFRYYLKDNKKAFNKFLHSVNWTSEELLGLWQKIDYQDSLHLLSVDFAANEIYEKKEILLLEKASIIRNYAVEILDSISTENIFSILLQLVQALRYESLENWKDSLLMKLLFSRAITNFEFATQLYWFVKMECEDLENLLAKEKDRLNPESKDAIAAIHFKNILDEFTKKLQGSDVNRAFIIKIRQQEELRATLRSLSIQVSSTADTAEKRRIALQKILEKSPFLEKAMSICIEPSILAVDLIPEKCTVFRSAMCPLKVSFKGFKEEKAGYETEYSCMFKNGDDLRQDQLVIQIFNLMNEILLKVNLDMRLTPYKVLACSKSDGFIEFVPNSQTIQAINKAVGLKEYLKSLVSKENDENSINDNYVKSCAGYSVITYIIGVGDRHLENLMLDNLGKLFHIDFGFILGHDPKMKMFQHSIKVNEEMIVAMGGKNSRLYKAFSELIVTSFNYLRRESKLIINLFYLMLHAGIKQISRDTIDKMCEKFLVEENDDFAGDQILMLLESSISAILPVWMDKFHEFYGKLK